MALETTYARFLSSPTTAPLASNASIHYVPTLTTIKEPTAILKHFSLQDQLLKKKENFLNVIEGMNKLCVESETTLKFDNGGGVYLPGLDDNFLVDRTVTLPMVHIVTFNADSKIQDVRIMWDQGSLLKSIEIIGSRNRTWPINEGKDQVRLVSNAADAISRPSGPGAAEEPSKTSRTQSRGGANGDKYTSLSLFQNREVTAREELPSAVAPRASAKPADRDYQDMFVDGNYLPEAQGRPPSPSKIDNPLKAGAGKQFTSNRLFDEEEIVQASPEKNVKTFDKKYNHFELGDPEADPVASSTANPNRFSKHGSKWDFADFATPEKPKKKVQDRNEKQFSWAEDNDQASKPLVHRPYKPRARPDAEAHFEFTDQGTPKTERPISSRGDPMHLYDERMMNTAADTKGGIPGDAMPLGNITNKAMHRKNFGSQFEFEDIKENPGLRDSVKDENAISKSTKEKANQSMRAHWEMTDESPQAKDRGINIQGDGMGGRRKAYDETKERGINIQGDGMGGRKAPGEKNWWEYD